MARMLSGTKGSTYTKPNGRNIFHVTPIVTMKMPEARKMETEVDSNTGQVVSFPEDTSLVVVIGSKVQKIPCTVEVFQEAINGDYGRRPDLHHFLYQKQVVTKDKKRMLEPVSIIATADNNTYEHNVLPTKADAFVMKFIVDLKDGVAFVSGCHYKFSPVSTVTIASSLSAATSLAVNDKVGGSDDLYIAAINQTPDPQNIEVVVRSRNADVDEAEIRQSGYLR